MSARGSSRTAPAQQLPRQAELTVRHFQSHVHHADWGADPSLRLTANLAQPGSTATLTDPVLASDAALESIGEHDAIAVMREIREKKGGETF